MTIEIRGDINDPEYKSAMLIKEKFEFDDELKNNENEIIIIPSVNCFGQNPEDIDIVIIGRLKKSKFLKKLEENAFCIVIEVKAHSSDLIVKKGTNWFVKYSTGEKDATYQNFKQKSSLFNYFSSFPNNNDHYKPYVSNILFFCNSRKSDFNDVLVEENSATIFKDFTLIDFFKKIRFNTISDYHFDFIINALTKEITATKLDLKKVTNICKKQIVGDQEYYKKLGTQLLIFRGRGGTGKTFRLLNFAYKLYNERLERVLILTYNTALISDVKRLFAIMQIKSSWFDNTIQIKSIHSFWSKILLECGIKSYDDYHNIENIKEMIDLITTDKTILDKLKETPNLLDWDYVMIDEAQDWPDAERDLIYTIFKSSQVIVADGVNQLIRTENACDWKRSRYTVASSQVVPLTKTLRQKGNIVKFLEAFCNKLNMPELEIESNDDLYGGDVKIIIGDYKKEHHEKLINTNKIDKNENVDMLFCVPPSNKEYNNKITNWGYNVWDGTEEKIRKLFPSDNSDIRIVNYKSCRGLEGWIVVNLELDSFYSERLRNFDDIGQQTIQSKEQRRKDSANNWLLIPLTRAIDTLVIHLKDKDNYISKKIIEIAKENPEFIEILE